MKEAWKPVVGFESSYEVSSLGRVKSKKRVMSYKGSDVFKMTWPEKLLKYRTDKDGYPTVTLFKDGIRHDRKVHKIVCETFHGPAPSPEHEVRHLDGIENNNVPSNLAWGTRKDNAKDRDIHGHTQRGSRHAKTKFTERDVLDIRLAIINGIPQKNLADKYDVSQHCISCIKSRKTWKHI